MNCVIFSCAETGRAFNSGLHAEPDDLRFVPPQWNTWLHCRICRRVHEFKFATARVCSCQYDCSKNGDFGRSGSAR
jgi:NADH:ubiquinone oxidoreductase subunit